LPDGVEEKTKRFRAGKEMRVTRQSINSDARLPSAPDDYSNFMTGNHPPACTDVSHKLTISQETIESELQRINKQAIQPWLTMCQQHHAMCKSPPHHVFLNLLRDWSGLETQQLMM